MRLGHDTVAALAAYKSARGMLDFEDAVTTLLAEAPAGLECRHPRQPGGGPVTATWDRARAIADAVLYEGYLLYPYRATSSKNQSRWQFGVVGPPGASAAGIGEDDTLSAQFLIDGDSELTLVVRFLQLQHRRAERDVGGGRFEPVDELTSGLQSWVTWDEAVECELSFGPFGLGDLAQPRTWRSRVADGTDIEGVDGGRLIRTRAAIQAELTIAVERDDGLNRVSVSVRNTGAAAAGQGHSHRHVA